MYIAGTDLDWKRVHAPPSPPKIPCIKYESYIVYKFSCICILYNIQVQFNKLVKYITFAPDTHQNASLMFWLSKAENMPPLRLTRSAPGLTNINLGNCVFSF